MEDTTILVAAAIIRHEEKVLIAQKKRDGKLYHNRWEFPKCEVEPGQEPREALYEHVRLNLEMRLAVSDIQGAYVSISARGRTRAFAYEATMAEYTPLFSNVSMKFVRPEELAQYNVSDLDMQIAERLTKQGSQRESPEKV